MRLVTFQTPTQGPRAGALDGDVVIDLAATDPSLPVSVRLLLEAGEQTLRRAEAAAKSPKRVVVENAKLLAPIPDPQKVIGVGLNYKDHAAEQGLKLPADPVIFSKFPSAVIGPDEPIVLPIVSQEIDFEAELVVVIGQRGKNIPEDRALEYVAGYTVGHDVSARDWQQRKDGKQWVLGKSFDTFAPSGPALVTKDEVPNPHSLAIKFRLNGETMQDSSTSQMAAKVQEIIAYISQVFTLVPGDLIYTGTPPGVGFARRPPVFMKPGDICEVEIESLGILRNPCVAEAK